MRRSEKVASQIAQEYFNRTLERQNSDEKDFFEVAVWEMKSALILAYEQGREDANSNHSGR